MIARKEEKNLPRCLGSILNLVDEIILVDTGSFDNTISVAENHGAWVFEMPWKKNFAAARNYALSKCTGEWILWIDADEELVCERPISEIREILENSKDHGVVAIPVINRYSDKNAESMALADRLFRAGRGVKWHGPIHEYVSYKGKHAHANRMKILHYGYDLPEEQLKAKMERNWEILLGLYKKQSFWGKPNPEIYRYLIQTLLAAKDYERCARYGEEYFDRSDRYGTNYPPDTCYSMYMMYATKLKDYHNALRWLSRGMYLYPTNIDINYCQYHYGKMKENLKAMLEGGQKYVEAYNKIAADCIHLGIGITLTYNSAQYKEVLSNLVTTHIAHAIGFNNTLRKEMAERPSYADQICRRHVSSMTCHLYEIM
jgi:glycosyltransferase involved in cell wall biosynthesis